MYQNVSGSDRSQQPCSAQASTRLRVPAEHSQHPGVVEPSVLCCEFKVLSGQERAGTVRNSFSKGSPRAAQQQALPEQAARRGVSNSGKPLGRCERRLGILLMGLKAKTKLYHPKKTLECFSFKTQRPYRKRYFSSPTTHLLVPKCGLV